MSSTPQDPMGTPFPFKFDQGINLDQVNENIYPFDDGIAPHLTNTGVLRDNGVTNLYETTAVDSNGQYVFYAPNGKKISLETTNGVAWGRVFIDGTPIDGSQGSTFGKQALASRVMAPLGAIDVAITSSGTWLLLTKASNGANISSSGVIYEYNPSTKTIIGTRTLTDGISSTLDNQFMCFVKTYQMTLANADIAICDFINSTDVRVRVSVAGTFFTVYNTTCNSRNFTGLTAYAAGGRYIVGGVPDNSSMPRSYSATSPYAVWTAINETSYLWAGIGITYNQALGIQLTGIPSNKSSAAFTTFSTDVTISTGGVLTTTPNTVAGLTIATADARTGFAQHSGRYKSTAATKFSGYIVTTQSNITRKDQTATDYAVIPQSAFELANASGLGNSPAIFVYGTDNNPGMVCLSESPSVTPNQTQGCAPICEYGAIDRMSPVTLWTVDNSTLYPVYVTIPTTNGVLVATINTTGFAISPISKDIVQLNDSWGTIIDTRNMRLEYNQGGQTPAFISDICLAGTNQLAWLGVAKYSNAADRGLITTAAGSSAGVVGFGATGTTAISWIGRNFNKIWYQSATGTLFAIIEENIRAGADIYTDTTVAYVQNSNLPVPIDAIYHDGGIQLVQGAALQTVNFSDADGFAQYYAGYALANQYPVSYQFFNLFGQLYGFDGTKIYRMPVNGATAGTPEQVAVATGLTFIANSPTIAWFQSSYDNALYAFNGGSNIEHWQPMTGVGLVSSGVFNVRENALYLQLADNTTLIFRDGYGGLFANAFTSQTTYTTDQGVFFVNNATPTTSKTWSYYAGSGTPLTLTWQSGFYGFGKNRWCRLSQAVFVLKVPDAANTNITINYKWITNDTNGTETATITGGTYAVSSTGYVRLKYAPTNDISYGFSLGISCSKKVTLYELTAFYTDGGIAPVTTTNVLSGP